MVFFTIQDLMRDVNIQPHLEYVDASYNRIQTLEGLRGVHKLKHLDLSWNHLTRDRDDIGVLRKHAPALENLDIRHNPWHKASTPEFPKYCGLKPLPMAAFIKVWAMCYKNHFKIKN